MQANNFLHELTSILIINLTVPFNAPVQWKEWGLLDYPSIIKTPMDLSLVAVRLSITSQSLAFLSVLYRRKK